MKLRLLLLTLLALGLIACDSPDQATETAPAETEAAQQAPEDEAAQIEALSEEAAESEETAVVEEKAAAEGEEIVLGAPAAEPRTDWKYQEGEHFRRMTSAQGTSSAPDKIEVAEVFWYGCPHCYDFDPILAEWKQELAADVAFVRIPVIWNPTNQLHARIMYTADALGKLPEIHEGIFKAMHQEGNSLTKEDDIVEFFARYDVDEAEFREAYNSFAVSSAVKRAENLTRRYGVRSVPVMIINGKYATDAPGVKTFADVIDVTDELVERERSGT
jgi:thiol:disulfide interchange protein DsbA